MLIFSINEIYFKKSSNFLLYLKLIILSFSKEINKNVIITRGADGAIAIKNREIFECDAKSDLNLVDLTGAGDLFAAGYLHGIINNLSIEKALDYGTNLSSKVIQQIGARIKNN